MSYNKLSHLHYKDYKDYKDYSELLFKAQIRHGGRLLLM